MAPRALRKRPAAAPALDLPDDDGDHGELALAYRVTDYPHLGMELDLGQVYFLPELQSRSGKRSAAKRRKLEDKLKDTTVFEPIHDLATILAHVRAMEAGSAAQTDRKYWIRSSCYSPNFGAFCGEGHGLFEASTASTTPCSKCGREVGRTRAEDDDESDKENEQEQHGGEALCWKCGSCDNVCYCETCRFGLALHLKRSVANFAAQQFLRRGDTQITDEEALLVLKLWGFKRNYDRRNVTPDGREWVHSDTVGLIRNRCGEVVWARSGREFDHVIRFLTRWLRERWPDAVPPDFPFTSISMNKDYAAKPHRDGNNAGPSILLTIGDFTGGVLRYWQEDEKKRDPSELLGADATLLDARGCPTIFDGRKGHAVTDFEGQRLSLVFFCIKCKDNVSAAMVRHAEVLGFQLPTPGSLARAASYTEQLDVSRSTSRRVDN